ncbi:hypothetical protein [Flavobacterium petrolei]|uniref:hypothetical protein n=1 Tax=Flavobacterium petrolei TaxID=2259594 RepID=UPI003757FC89
MKKHYFAKKVLQACLLFLIMMTTNMSAQVGIGTVTPHASSVLDVSSTNQGMLTPRMTTSQRTAIVTPADGLIVYDTDLKSFYHYNSTTVSWNRMSSDANGRLKFKRVKSTDVLATVLAAEKTLGGNITYKLDPGTLYEINGAVILDLPIELNNAYIAGLDSGEDKLVKVSGDLFTGTTGGSVRVLTLVASGGNVFNITAVGTQNLILRDGIIANSANVGLIKGFSLVFVSIIQYVGNSNGIIYENIEKLLINNAGWFGGALPLGNSGTYEKIVGTFGQVAKQGGFSEVTGTNIGFDVFSDPTITGDAVMESVVFTGAVSGAGAYVKPYTVGSYAGYNFNNSWNVRCAGIPTEGDSFATGNLYDSNNTSSSRTTATNVSQDYKVITNATASSNLYRVAANSTGRLTYLGKKGRIFNVNASVSFKESSGATGNTNYVFYLVKIGTNGTTVTPLQATETFIDTNSGFVQSFPISGTVQLNTNESVEIYLKRITNPTSPKISIDVYSLNISMN